jgi:hypothetical protein
MEYVIDQEVLSKAEQYIDEPEVFEDDVVEKSAPTSTAVIKPLKQAKARRVGTKQALVNEFFLKYGDDRQAILNYLMTDLGMSRAGATTYYYNAKKNAKVGK